jgi:glucose-6-phosphate isomerase
VDIKARQIYLVVKLKNTLNKYGKTGDAMHSIAWQALQAHQQTLANTHIQDLFKEMPNRFEQFSVQAGDILLDFSKQKVTPKTMDLLCDLATEKSLVKHREAMFSGAVINHSENRPVLHTALRDPTQTPILVNGQNIKPAIHAVLDKMEKWARDLRTGHYVGSTGEHITDILCLGIGGSDLGPRMVYAALEAYKTGNINLHFVSNVDGRTVEKTLQSLNPVNTLCIINSKTFTTLETLLNTHVVKQWLQDAIPGEIRQHLVAVTANAKGASEFGIALENIFEFWPWVGGRYSIWSAVGLPIVLTLGMPVFKAFLSGAHAMDVHFCTAPLEKNMPVLLALLGIWNINGWGCHTHAMMPYDDGLSEFPAYLQQLEMESNGKAIGETGKYLEYSTAPVIWGGVGCNGQHAYMQLLHQGTEVIPLDFLIAVQSHSDLNTQQHALVASCLSQSKALMEGSLQYGCRGNRPSNTLMYPKLTPKTLGALIALYEHKVFTQGIIWGVNSFDQPGVELGKILTNALLPYLQEKNAIGAHKIEVDIDASTAGLIRYYQRN